MAISTPLETWSKIIFTLSNDDNLSCGLVPVTWFSVKYEGLFIFPISWYKDPTLASIELPPISFAEDSAKFATFIEWWNVPGALFESSFSNGELVSDSSSNETSETKLNTFSYIYIKG